MRKKKLRVITLAIATVILPSMVAVIGLQKYPVRLLQENNWAIGIYEGRSPFELNDPDHIKNPILTASDVTDVKAVFVADPFMFKQNRTWYLFFEVLNALTNHGDIGYAQSEDGIQWTYKRVILDEPFHLSYPYVFQWDDEIYMIPESATANNLRLYKAMSFPETWEYVCPLLEGQYGDHAIFRFNETWWLMANAEPRANSTLRLYFADRIVGPWTEHPASPIVKDDAKKARPGGRVLVLGSTVIRYAQDCERTYGKALNAFEITTLTKKEYQEKPSPFNPILKAAKAGWNRHGMHQLDAHELEQGTWIACVDGYARNFIIKVEY